MGISTDYFVASSDDLAALTLAGGPAGTSPGLPVVQTKGLDPVVVMGSLEAILTGRDYDVVAGNPRQGLELAHDDDGVWVIALTEDLRDALAESDEARLRLAGAELAATEEVDATDAQDVAAVVDDVVALGELARIAQARGEAIYCWMCL